MLTLFPDPLSLQSGSGNETSSVPCAMPTHSGLCSYCVRVHAGMYVHCQSLVPTIYGITCNSIILYVHVLDTAELIRQSWLSY